MMVNSQKIDKTPKKYLCTPRVASIGATPRSFGPRGGCIIKTKEQSNLVVIKIKILYIFVCNYTSAQVLYSRLKVQIDLVMLTPIS